jgi:hypothetical protein
MQKGIYLAGITVPHTSTSFARTSMPKEIAIRKPKLPSLRWPLHDFSFSF